MNVVLFAHPAFTAHQSMPRFTRMLAEGLRARGHVAEIWAPQAWFGRLPAPGMLRKWFGYLDQYVLFPTLVRRRRRHCPAATLFVFTDHALGPWVPLVKERPHVIHCHDFLAQRSALGEIVENPTGWTGRQYQAYIRQGYRQGQHFISVSETTRHDLHRFLPAAPASSAVVYNGLNQKFVPYDAAEARQQLGYLAGLDVAAGYLLHVGGNQWYKNRPGVLEMYEAWRTQGGVGLPLLLIGEPPGTDLLAQRSRSAFAPDIHFLTEIDDQGVRLAYAGAMAFLFPSLAEGFGWPIAEAMAAGCPVITTQEAPMTEVGGRAAFYIPRRPASGAPAWAAAAAAVMQQVVALSPAERQAAVQAGLVNASRFGADEALNQIEAIYQQILQSTANV